MIVSDSIQERFAVQAAQTPEAVAVSSGGIRMTYHDLDERANRLAHQLLGMGVRPEDPVAVMMERSADLIVAILAVVKAGASYLPLHSAYPLKRMQWVMDNASRPVLLTDKVTQEAGLPESRHVVLADTDLSAFPATDPGIKARPGQLAYVMYTSGTQGNPMGVAVNHRGVLGLALDTCWNGGRHERVLMMAPYAFGVSTYEIWVPLLRGGRIVIPPPGDIDVRTLTSLIKKEEVTALHLTAGLFRVVAEEAPECLTGVREVLTGGDVITPTAVQRVMDTCPDIVVRAMYGATELSSFAASSPMRAPYEVGPSVPLGRPLDDVQAYILDEYLEMVEVGTIGELYIGGERLARGYAGRADLTAERFVADPFAGSGGRMYRTGDLARWTPDGLIDFVGRATDQVKIHGFRVEPAEIEHTLTTYPGLADVVIIAREDESRDKQLIAYVVAQSGDLDLVALRNHAKDLLPHYMVPASFITLEKLPLTPNGKLDRKALPAPVFEGGQTYRAPSTDRQKTLCSLFAEILGIERVGVDDSFFELDGQSMLAIRLINRVQTALTVALSLQDLFDAPTVAELDQRIESALTEFRTSAI